MIDESEQFMLLVSGRGMVMLLMKRMMVKMVITQHIAKEFAWGSTVMKYGMSMQV